MEMETPQEYFNKLFFKPRKFFKEIIDYQHTKYFNIVFVIFCVGYGIDRLHKNFTKKDLRGELEQVEFMNNWPMFWIIACIGGLIGGYIAYLVSGWFYNIRIKWSEGVGDIDKSRVVYIFSNLFVSGFVIINALFQTIFFDIPQDPEADFNPFELVSLVIFYGLLYHTIFISYNAALTFTNINVSRAKLWFLILPGSIYIILISLFLTMGLNTLL